MRNFCILEQTMKLMLAIGALAVLSTLVGSGIATAQNESDTFKHTLRGCLKEGTKANVYSLTDENGKMWELRSKAVQLGSHVNHKVAVTGKIPQESKRNGNGGDASSENRFTVTSLKMVSDSCDTP
jgi:hypothetical protein